MMVRLVNATELWRNLQPTGPCLVCAAGACATGACFATFRWSAGDPRYRRCGCFERHWLERLTRAKGHGVVLRSRQPMVRDGLALVPGPGNRPAGWVLGTGRDEIGYYIDLEPVSLGRSGGQWRLVAQTSSEAPERWYIGALLGVHILEQHR